MPASARLKKAEGLIRVDPARAVTMVCAMSAMARAKFARGNAAMSKAERHRRREALRTCPFKDQHQPQVSDDVAATTL